MLNLTYLLIFLSFRVLFIFNLNILWGFDNFSAKFQFHFMFYLFFNFKSFIINSIYIDRLDDEFINKVYSYSAEK
jgi:hypothetical protein